MSGRPAPAWTRHIAGAARPKWNVLRFQGVRSHRTQQAQRAAPNWALFCLGRCLWRACPGRRHNLASAPAVAVPAGWERTCQEGDGHAGRAGPGHAGLLTYVTGARVHARVVYFGAWHGTRAYTTSEFAPLPGAPRTAAKVQLLCGGML
jgi:hypothetical protein